jgi:hypothetical protein
VFASGEGRLGVGADKRALRHRESRGAAGASARGRRLFLAGAMWTRARRRVSYFWSTRRRDGVSFSTSTRSRQAFQTPVRTPPPPPHPSIGDSRSHGPTHVTRLPGGTAPIGEFSAEKLRALFGPRLAPCNFHAQAPTGLGRSANRSPPPRSPKIYSRERRPIYRYARAEAGTGLGAAPVKIASAIARYTLIPYCLDGVARSTRVMAAGARPFNISIGRPLYRPRRFHHMFLHRSDPRAP